MVAAGLNGGHNHCIRSAGGRDRRRQKEREWYGLQWLDPDQPWEFAESLLVSPAACPMQWWPALSHCLLPPEKLV